MKRMTELIDKKVIQDALIEKISRLNAEGEKSINVAKEFIRFKRYVDGLTPIESTNRPTNTPTDLISRQDEDRLYIKIYADDEPSRKAEKLYQISGSDRQEVTRWVGEYFPSADRPKGEYTTEQVAEILANAFGDECACNFNSNDEWLPQACKYAETCPTPKEKHGCWMQYLMQGGADMRGTEEEHTMEEFMYGQDMGNPEDGSL